MNLLRKKRYWLLALLLMALAYVGYKGYSHTASVTRIALVNFPGYQSSGIVLSNADKHIEYGIFDEHQIEEYKNYDFILAFGMGLSWTEEERSRIDALLDKGLPLQVVMTTVPENNIANIDSTAAKRILEYIDNGNRKNYQSLAHYVRKYIDRKQFFVTEPAPLAPAVSEVYFHIDEAVAFEKKADFEAYLKKQGYWHDGGSKILLIGGINDPFAGNKQNIDSLIEGLHREGHNVYPVSSMLGRLDFLKEVSPDLVVYFPHGRVMMGMGEQTVDYLRERNIPIITPITLLQSQEEWEADPMGMMGGFMSQTIVMPELDGAVYPYVFTTQEKNEEGHHLLKAIPHRLEKFTQLATRYLRLKTKANKDKKLAIYFFKGPGQESLLAQGLETVPSLYNFLRRLESEGYNLAGLPRDVETFRKQIMLQGQVLKPYAEGDISSFVQKAKPELVEASVLQSWLDSSLPLALREQLEESYGTAPGRFMTYEDKAGRAYLALARLQYGNVALLPQPAAGIGDDSFAIAHGANMPPPYPYVGAYLWAHHAFDADAMIHFGTHGSLEFTPRKQVALSDMDWGDQLVAGLPHFYYYTIANVGESMMAKRRSYAALVSYLSPAFAESGARGIYKDLVNAITAYYQEHSEEAKKSKSLAVKKLAIQLGLHRELRLDSLLSKPYSESEIERIDNFAEEIANEKVTGKLYTTGEVYEAQRLDATVVAMAADPIAYAQARLDYLRGKIGKDYTQNKRLFSSKYLEPAKRFVAQNMRKPLGKAAVLSYAGISAEELDKALTLVDPKSKIMQMMAAMGAKDKAGMNMPVIRGKKSEAKHPSWIPKVGKRPDHVGGGTAPVPSSSKPSSAHQGANKPAQMMAEANRSVQAERNAKPTLTAEEEERQRDWSVAVVELAEAIQNISAYREALERSPEQELNAFVNALSGGYLAPSSGGDAVANPKAVPTGRNLYSINAETTPSERAWSRGVELAQNTIKQYKEKHGRYPQKVSYTFWSSEFIESEGTTIAQVLYMIGAEPIRNGFGRVADVRLIPIKELGRPRIDVVIQTSGQFRDLAASRLELLHRAITLASEAKEREEDNYVASGSIQTEKALVEAGLSPKEARGLSTSRIFGGINGMYGTGIQEMITAGDQWQSRDEIAEVYLNNMGASYTGQKDWGKFSKHLFRAALERTDVVVQPRQSNTWGALSLDHVYEFMGGLNLTVRSVTGKEPEAYFADYRNRNNARIQDLKESIGVESRATVFNPKYISEMLSGGASSVSRLTEVITNTYGWEVTKPEVIDDAMWQEYYDTYITDKYDLGVQQRIEELQPSVLQEMTAVMLETARKGMWSASPEQVKRLSELHADLTKRFGATGSGMSSGNKLLQRYISDQLQPEQAKTYQAQLQRMNSADAVQSNDAKDAVRMKKEEQNPSSTSGSAINKWWVAALALLAFVGAILFVRRRQTEL